ncbi:hypothetical protein F4813DRAFT_71844 [Daldinia decipiens]|uniref:uncharacterized protein n=1 Tax=Daldinia decipiens TaxID=326647 RepID=UPI0020C4A2FF|nr:uncharacterized protein F4813DRAFT_71844 [Daldinia decipiens]KAI1657691.1 hypothetical protein F4813DRAFT_71844 [Daldinia decipiens]
MANNLIPLEGFHLEDLQDTPWALFDMDLIEEDSAEIDMLVGDPNSHQFDILSATIDTVCENTPGHGSTVNGGIERRRSGSKEVLDMNNPIILNDYASLVLFANNPSAHHHDIENCDSSKQNTIQALAAKLDLQYSYDDSLRKIRLQKKSFGKDLEQYSRQPGTTTQDSIAPFTHQVSSPSPHWKPSNTTGRRLRNFPDISSLSCFLHTDVTIDMDMSSSDLNLGSTGSLRGVRNNSLANSQYYDLSEDEQDWSRIASRPVPSSLRRGSWNRLSRTLKEVGACWRCKFLRKKCDPDQQCKACPKSGTVNSRWQAIGCKRGTLLDHMPRISLCPKSNAHGMNDTSPIFNQTKGRPDILEDMGVGSCLQDASDRLDNVFVSEGDTYIKVVLEILCSPMAIMANNSLSLRHDVEANAIHIAWGLIDITSAKEILLIKSVEHILDVIKAAITYETEYGQSQAVPLAIKCLRNCIDILRLQDGGHLTYELHDDCGPGVCCVRPFQELSSNIKSFTDELSKIIFRKENRLHEKRWWLSAFYSLWIQSYVRRTIRFLENQPEFQFTSETKQIYSAYLLLAVELFDATSASFDPLTLTWSLEEEPQNMDVRLMKYYRLAQKALLSEEWAYDTVSSVDYLRRLYYDGDVPSTTQSREETLLSPSSYIGNDDSEYHGPFNARPPSFQSHKLTQPQGRFSVPLRTRSSAKRRAGSPLQDVSFIRRNGSSSSMLDSRDVRNRAFSIASPGSPMSSAYSFAYGTSSSTKWNGSGDSLAEMAKLYGTSPPNPRDQPDYLSPSTGHRSSLHHKSSNESFLELPRTLNKRRPINIPASPKDSLPGFFLCECCPKKPKKFETMEELSAHKAEKRHQCSFCGARFKSKNEAERHENSLHVRRHAWVCSNMLSVGYMNVFQESASQLGISDTCGYCGEDFPRNGEGVPMYANEQDWEDRLNHVKEVHKFGECNSAKQFYRADHFRQHLKHSHAATLGRWISAIESRCMVDLPEP